MSGIFNAFNFLDPTVIHIQVPSYIRTRVTAGGRMYTIYMVGTEQLCANNYSKNAKRAKYVEIVECRAGIEFVGFHETTLISRTRCVSYIGESFFFHFGFGFLPSFPPLPVFLSPVFLSPAYIQRRRCRRDGRFRASVKVKRERGTSRGTNRVKERMKSDRRG